jgi:hypothetical protein
MLSTDYLGRLPLYDYLHTPNRLERINNGALAMGMAVMTREMLEPHMNQSPDVNGIWDYVPVAGRRNSFGKKGLDRSERFVGWRQKLRTW